MLTAEVNTKRPGQLRSLLLDLFVMNLLVLPLLICELFIEPTRRGFFCDDASISYPFHEETIKKWMVALLLMPFPILIFMCVEYKRFYRTAETRPFMYWRAPAWLLEAGQQFHHLATGLMLTIDLVIITKYVLGNLRPHFLAVCQPEMLDGTRCADAVNHGRYIENYVCTYGGVEGVFTASDERQARLSFPSGHTSPAIFAVVYLALYLQKRMTWRAMCIFLQFTLLMVGWFVGMSRYIDHWHHGLDVMTAVLIGGVCAWLMAVYIAKLFKNESVLEIRQSLKLQETPEQPLDVAGTPPNSLQSTESLSSLSNESKNP